MTTRLTTALTKGMALIDFIQTHNRLPKQSNKTERKMYNWWQRIKQAKIGKGTSVFYPELQTQAEQAGLPTLYDPPPPPLTTALAKGKALIEFIQTHNRMPKQSTKTEQPLYNWMKHAKHAKHAKAGNTTIFYPELQTQADKAGLPTLYE